ncbi:transglycosylase domain-containing protein [Sphingobacterium sp.]|uniref:transglycosylase domain-containing protein n=1 Tax=Sphingobacterium sp. TaxID=341027 RepID=UPI002FD96979
MNEDLNGFVVYNKTKNNKIPYAVISNSCECHALTSYIPQQAKNFIVEIEDKRFYSHNGYDLMAISRAFINNILQGKIAEGGSTISQQLARNMMRNNSKTFARKFKEIIKAIQIENELSKDDILEQYFNNVYFGGNLRGIRSASLSYFCKEPNFLNISEILYLLVLLRGPNYYLNNPKKSYLRFELLNNVLLNSRRISRSQYRKISKYNVKLKKQPLIRITDVVANHIISYLDTISKTIISTIDNNIQKEISVFVKASKYPVSVIAIREGKVIGVDSTYGAEYVFVSKSNVGSTLKPFLYCFARTMGVASNTLYNAKKNELEWHVREVSYESEKLNIQEALLKSNNNAFINIADEIGIDKSTEFLSSLFNQQKKNFPPSSILGATNSGISIYELAITYDKFFNSDLNQYKIECKELLSRIFRHKTGLNISNVLLKTGTTNDNKERIAVFSDSDTVFAILRNNNPIDDFTKDGNFIETVTKLSKIVINKPKDYKWR